MTSEIYGGNIHSLHAVVNAIAHIDLKPPWLTKERFVARGAAAIAVAGGVVLGICLGFHHHTPEQAAACLAFHQLAANQLRGNNLRWTAAEGVGQGWESVVAMGVAREAQPH